MAYQYARDADSMIEELHNIQRVLVAAYEQAELADSAFQVAFNNETGWQDDDYVEVQSIFDQVTALVGEAATKMTELYPAYQISVGIFGLVASFVITNPTNDKIVARDEYGNTLTGVWEGFEAGDIINITGTENGDDGAYTINSVNSGYIDLTSNGTLTANAADTTMLITLWKKNF